MFIRLFELVGMLVLFSGWAARWLCLIMGAHCWDDMEWEYEKQTLYKLWSMVDYELQEGHLQHVRIFCEESIMFDHLRGRFQSPHSKDFQGTLGFWGWIPCNFSMLFPWFSELIWAMFRILLSFNWILVGLVRDSPLLDYYSPQDRKGSIIPQLIIYQQGATPSPQHHGAGLLGVLGTSVLGYFNVRSTWSWPMVVMMVMLYSDSMYVY